MSVDADPERVEDDPIYPSKLAPPHLKTFRQLQAAGLRPNGQRVAGWVPVRWRGRTRLARLFDVHLAAPKRTASPAQRASAIKAAAEHQARAAERRGFSRAELAAEGDPGPGFTDPTTYQEENTMSDPIRADLSAVEQQRGEDAGAADAAVSVGPEAEQPAAGAAALHSPQEHGQRVAYLLATVAANQARAREGRLDAAIQQAHRDGPEAVAQIGPRVVETMHRAEARLQANPERLGPASVQSLADALVWHRDSQIAAEHLAQITDAYAQTWGVRVDPAGEMSVSIDPEFDPITAQLRAESAALRARESAVVDIVSAMPLTDTAKAAVSEAISTWHLAGDLPAPGSHLTEQAARRELLAEDLAAAKLTESDRAGIEFAVDYLRGDTARVDLLASPVVVDPGHEVRGRIAGLLDNFAHGRIAPAEVGEEIQVMTAADQARVREVGKAIKAGQQVEVAVWPGWVDRDAVAEQLDSYVSDAEDLNYAADYLPEAQAKNVDEPQRWGISDDIEVQIIRMAAVREQLLAVAREGKGLASMEAANLAAVVGDIDAGRIVRPDQMPEMIWADERSKLEAEEHRLDAPAGEVSGAVRSQVGRVLTSTNSIDRNTREGQNLRSDVSSIGDTIFSVGTGSVLGLEHDRQQYADKRARLDKSMQAAGVDPAVQDQARQIVNDLAGKAGELGKGAAERRQQWQHKNEAVLAARDDAIAQQRAMAAGRTTTAATGQVCTPRPGQAAAAEHAPARAGGRRQLHSQEVGR